MAKSADKVNDTTVDDNKIVYVNPNNAEPEAPAEQGHELPPEVAGVLNDPISIEKITVTDFTSLATSTKIIMNIPADKPRKHTYFRVHPDPGMQIDTYILENPEDKEKPYLVAPALRADLFSEILLVRFYTTIDRQGKIGLLKVRLPGDDGRWYSSHQERDLAANIAMGSWIRLVWNSGSYEILKAGGDLGDPVWPNMTLHQLINIVFRDRYITNIDHPMIRALRGLE